ncbi:MAG: RNA polymerase sigma factor [Acidobacteria bacterium]|nr:RNA polymerase sigma factor [Acidobacteriota bacterium]
MVRASDSDRSDEALMADVAVGQLDAFEILVTRHQNRVYRMALQMLANEEDAWDVSQEIFIKIYHARESYTEEAKFTTWLYRIANNAVIDRIRQLKRQSRFQSLEDSVSEPMSDTADALRELAVTEMGERMSAALMDLSERQRGMVIMKYYEGFSVKEIADVFECADGTVKATLFQAIRNLRDRLGELGVFNAEVVS